MSKKRDTENTFVPTEVAPTVGTHDVAAATFERAAEAAGDAAAALAPVVNETPPIAAPLVHRKTARLASRLGASLANAAALAQVEAGRVKLCDAPAVLYTARKGEYGHCGPGVPSTPIACVVRHAHNDEVCDLVAVDEDGFEHALASCTLAGTRDTKAGDPGTFEVVG